MSVVQAHGLRPRVLVAWGACLCAAFLIWPVQRRVDHFLAQRASSQDQLYFGSAKVVEKMSLGYRSLLADIYWMRTIQYYGRRGEADRRPVRYKNLAALLDITTALDPDLIDAYRAGSTFLAEPDPVGAGQPREAIDLLDRGIAHNSSDWRLIFDKGFIYFWYLKDFKEAGKIWLATARIPGAPGWMEPLAAMSLSRGGALETARSIWQRQYEESNREDVKNNALNHLVSIQVSEEIWTLEFLVRKYQQKTGLLPWTLQDLVSHGFLRQLPIDPSGAPYQFDPQTAKVELSPQSKVHYIPMPDIYRQAFVEDLTRRYASR